MMEALLNKQGPDMSSFMEALNNIKNAIENIKIAFVMFGFFFAVPYHILDININNANKHAPNKSPTDFGTLSPVSAK